MCWLALAERRISVSAETEMGRNGWRRRPRLTGAWIVRSVLVRTLKALGAFEGVA